jgi:hypothetical protein
MPSNYFRASLATLVSSMARDSVRSSVLKRMALQQRLVRSDESPSLSEESSQPPGSSLPRRS